MRHAYLLDAGKPDIAVTGRFIGHWSGSGLGEERKEKKKKKKEDKNTGRRVKTEIAGTD